MSDYAQAYATLYEYRATGLDGDVQFYVEEAQRAGSPVTGRRFVVWDTREYDAERQVISQYFVHEELDDEGRVILKTYAPLTLRYVYRYEMQHLLELCGYKIEALYGDFRRGLFRYGGEQIWVARRQ